MTKTRLIPTVIIVLFSTIAIGWWQMSRTQRHGSTEPVRITMHLWPGYFHAFIAQEKGFFAEEGVDVDLEIIEGIDENLDNFRDGNVDAAFGLQSDAMLLAAKGLALQIVYIANFSNGGDVVVT